MKKIFPSTKTYVSQSKITGAERGVFASENIDKGETIESCPTIEIPKQELEFLQNSFLTSYIFFCGKNKERLLIALGFGSMYNHNYTPNAEYKIDPQAKKIEFSSLKTIHKGEEITVNYVQESKSEVPLWFEV